MSNVCYLLVGLPGSGKTTAAKELLKDFPDIEIVSTDEYLEKIALEKGLTYNQVYAEHIDAAEKHMSSRIQFNTTNKKDFIWDQTNVYKNARGKKIRRLNNNKYEVVAIVVELTPEELEKRINKRSADGGKYISKKIMEELKKNYSRPSYDEGFSQIILILDDNIPQVLSKPKSNILKS